MARIRAVTDGGDTLWTPHMGGKPPRHATWEVVVRIGRDGDGLYRRRSKRIRGTWQEAQRLARQMEQRYRGARYTADAPRTLNDAVNRYIIRRETVGAVMPGTRQHYRTLAKRIARDPIGSADLISLRTADLEAFYERLAQEYSPRTVAHFHALLRSTIKWCVRLEWLAPPGPEPQAPTVPPPQPVSPLPEDLSYLATVWMRDPRHRPKAVALLLAGITGCRRGEVCAWRWSDFDLTAGTLLIQRTVSSAGTVQSRTKTGRNRRITLGPQTIAIVAHEWERYVEACHLQRRAPNPDSYVFSSALDHETPLRPGVLSDAFRALRDQSVSNLVAEAERAPDDGTRAALLHRAVRIGAIRFKDTRSFAASQMVAAGIDIATSAARLGHQPEVELAHYARPANDGAAARLLEELLVSALLPSADLTGSSRSLQISTASADDYQGNSATTQHRYTA